MNKNIDIKNIKVAKRYAKALSTSASDCIDEVLDNLNLINETIFENNEFRTFFMHPVISLNDKKEAVKSAFENKINKISFNFIQTLLDENRFSIFKTILELYKEEVNAIKNIKQVEVLSAVEIEENSKQKLKDKLKEKLNKDVKIDYHLDESIIGGLIVKVEDKVIDLSLKTKFETLKQNL